MKGKSLAALACVLILGVASAALLLADDDNRHGRGGRHGRRASQQADVVPAVHAEACGGCHFAYQPWLLPAASWEKHLAGLSDHFGATVTVPPGQEPVLRAYLLDNAADRAHGKRSGKILRGLGSQSPLRITELPSYRHKHSRIRPEVFSRKAVGGQGNCPACHRGAAQGDYDDDGVRIP